jgi:two-component system LytT family sensor kinase
MRPALPLQNLHRLILLMTIFINLFVSVLLLISRVGPMHFIITTFIRGFILIYLLGIVNIFTLHLVRKYAGFIKRASLVRYVSGACLSFVICVILTVLFAYLGGRQAELHDRNIITIQFISFVIFTTLIIVMQDQVLLQHSKAQAELENMQLKAAVSEASNLLLRQQIHPHFLFNSLTVLKSLYKKDAARGESYLTMLASFLRASISSHSSKITELQAELMLCKDYMEMQKIRFGDAVQYEVRVSKEAKTRFVPFFAVQVLLENAIKHNALTEASPLKLTIEDNGSYLTIENNLQIKANKDVSTGLGLANLAERYRLLSGDQIDIKRSPETFSVTIKMYENENCDH